MVRMSKQGERRAQFPRKTRAPSVKTGTKQDVLANGYKSHENAVSGEMAGLAFIPKIK